MTNTLSQRRNVNIKPLVWHRADLAAWGEYANAGLIRYTMTWKYRDDPEVWFIMKCDIDGRILYEGGDEDAAKDAAQKDCEGRIRSTFADAEATRSDAWRDALQRIDYPLTDELWKRTTNAAIFAAAAYERAGGGDEGTSALRRAFLTAMVDFMHPDLDHLRVDPSAAEAARKGGNRDGEH